MIPVYTSTSVHRHGITEAAGTGDFGGGGARGGVPFCLTFPAGERG